MKKFYQHYATIVRRGKINDKTTLQEFIDKMKEELKEVEEAELEYVKIYEITDLLCVCTNCLIHLGIDIKKAVKLNLDTQKDRVNKSFNNQ